MNFHFTEGQITAQTQFKLFSDEKIAPYAQQHDEEEQLCDQVLQSMRESDYLGSMIPKQYGGMELDTITIGLLNEEIGRGCASVRSLLTVHGMVALGIMRWGTETQRAYWLPRLAKGDTIGAFGLTEPNVGSDAKSVSTTASVEDDTYILNGVKKWITMGQIADVFLIMAQLDGKPTAFLMERNCPGLTIKPMRGLLGARASMIAELNMENCRIPVDNIIGSPGTGLSHVALSCLDYGRYTVSWGAIGTAQACLESSVDYVRKRKQFGRPLRDYQLIQKMITEMIVNIKASRLLCLKAGYLKDEGDPDSIMDTWTAKYFSSIMVNKVASDAVQIHGANGCSSDYPVERYFRDARINEIIEGTTQMHEILISTHGFRTI
ncbi:acyl-CoA dehydrogenase [Paenibacillus sp. HJL G12]|uniref:Acyl-CoA dehydrogenase n=1 Tax=Paenibacillus dendrobii TaxID=2691084 RepID=A0A7X3IJT6_9BACL|nr:acyl-CoA dehydrogenase family protein [Paenibacillus dendrobii]MWV44656.1 acyl-CoA dehydrogenase [Paenibacillus dendrobii]